MCGECRLFYHFKSFYKMASFKKRLDSAINASSMADIAFLLLIFFLVTTTVLQDKGIAVLLPPLGDNVLMGEVKSRNLLSVFVNADNQLLVEGKQIPITRLKEIAKVFISNPEKREDLAVAPDKAVISLHHDRGTEYDTYLQVYNELKAAYNELWNELSLSWYGKPYHEEMPLAERKAIRAEIPFVISEAEPTDYVSVQ